MTTPTKYFGLSYIENGPIHLLCRDLQAGHFEVVNGLWEGHFENNEVFVKRTKHRHAAFRVWSGTWPKGCFDYNDAIIEINKRIARAAAKRSTPDGVKEDLRVPDESDSST